MLILRTLLFGPAHGHQIAKHIQSTTADGRARLSLPSAASAGASGVGRIEMGDREGSQTRVQVLPADASGKATAHRRRVEMETTDGRNRPNYAAGRGELRCWVG